MEPTGKFKDLIKEIENLTTLELADLVKALEERFGVSAAAPVAAAGAPAAGGSGAAQEEEKANYTVILADSGSQKIAVIKALREINQELGLKEAKDIADAPPKEILKDAPKEKAEEAKKKLEDAGAKVELK
ncbi:MAG: 50S ribosomal protein L7/L12 [Patescibacteria group bacterium]|nr:50S ribosomal protein L7/L12 [Patescibacteria group bacterium]